MENWELWQKRIVAYSMLEKANRKTLKEVIGQLNGSSDEIKGWYMHGASVFI